MKPIRPSEEFWQVGRDWAADVLKQNERAGRQNKYDYQSREAELSTKARGFVGEMVVARLTGLPHNTTVIKAGESMAANAKKADVGDYIEVRTSVRQPAVYRNDPPGRVVVGLRYVPRNQTFKVLGWTYAGYARTPANHSPYQGVERWLIPDAFWQPWETLPDCALEDDYPRSAWSVADDEDEEPIT